MEKQGRYRTQFSIAEQNRWSLDDKFRALGLLEKNKMDYQKTAETLGISKMVLSQWKKNMWKTYIDQKDDIQAGMLTVEAKKLILYEGTSKTYDSIIKLVDKTVKRIGEDEAFFQDIKPIELINLLGTVLPYVLEKKIATGVKEPSKNEQNNFFINVLNKIKDGNTNN